MTQIDEQTEFYYFAYGSCMCPTDLARTLGESVEPFLIGTAIASDYRLGFYFRSPRRQCGMLDLVSTANHVVYGVLYRLPWRLSSLLDDREYVPQGGYRHEFITVSCHHQPYHQVRTYVVVNKLPQELAPDDRYAQVVLRGASAARLPSDYCTRLHHHIYNLQHQPQSVNYYPSLASA